MIGQYPKKVLPREALEKGVAILLRHAHADFLMLLRRHILRDASEWWKQDDVGVNGRILDILRSNGFRGEDSPTGIIDNIYDEIAEEAVRRIE